ELGEVAGAVPHVRVTRDETEQHALAAAADQDGRMRPAHRLRAAPRLVQPVVAAAERRSLLSPEELLQRERLVELREPDADRRELVAVAVVLALVPSRTHAVDEPPAGEHVDGRRELRPERRRAVRVARHEDPPPDPPPPP